MKSNYTHICFVLDRSGSMNGCWNDTLGGLAALVADQKTVDGDVTYSLYAFDDVIDRVVHFSTEMIVPKTIFPRNGTALYDGFAHAVKDTGEALSKMPESRRPDKVLIVVLTDGGENASRKTNIFQVREILEHQKSKYNWEFSFLGASFDAKSVTQAFGHDVDMSWNYSKGMEANTFTNYSNAVRGMRGGQSLKACMSNLEKEVK